MNTLAKYSALGVAPWPLARAAFNAPFVRLYRRRALGYALYVGLYAAMILAIALTTRWLLIPVALAATAGTIAQAWIARPSLGRARRLPPGALPAVSTGYIADDRFIGRELKRHGPIIKTTLLTAWEPVVCIEGLRPGSALLTEHRARLEGVGMQFDDLIPAGFLRSMKPRDHGCYKAQFRSALTDDLVAGCADAYSAYARDLVETLAADAGGTMIDPRPHLSRYATRSLMTLLLGLSPGDDGFEQVERLYLESGPLNIASTLNGCADEQRDAAQRVVTTARRVLMATRESEPARESVLGRLREQDVSALDDPNVVLNVVFLMATGSYDITGLLHWITKMLGDNPEWCGSIRDDPGLSRCVVQETLRLAQSEFISRRVTSEIEVDGYVIPKGWYVRVCVQESHRSASAFEEPARFDPRRFSSQRFTRAEYAPFGMLEHMCLGVETTFQICIAFLNSYCMHDWKLGRDARPEFDGFHWRPSRKLRIALAERD